MAEPTSDKHYEEKFEFPLWKLIKKYAEENDVSYAKAYKDVHREYQKNIRYRDTKFEMEEVGKRGKEIKELAQQWAGKNKIEGGLDGSRKGC